MPTVLVVEDDKSISSLIGEILQHSEYGVVIAGDGQSALNSLSMVHPDLVLSDLMMPVMGGKELALKMQADPRYRDIPVILMTALNTIPDLQWCKFVAVLRKPLDIDTLLDTISSSLPQKVEES